MKRRNSIAIALAAAGIAAAGTTAFAQNEPKTYDKEHGRKMERMSEKHKGMAEKHKGMGEKHERMAEMHKGMESHGKKDGEQKSKKSESEEHKH